MILSPDQQINMISEAAGIPVQTLDQAGRVSKAALPAKLNPLSSSVALQRLFAALSFNQNQPVPFIMHDSWGLCCAAFPLGKGRGGLRLLGPAAITAVENEQLAELCQYYGVEDETGLGVLLNGAVLPLQRFAAFTSLAYYAEWGIMYDPSFLVEQANYIQYGNAAALAQHYADLEFDLRENAFDITEQAAVEGKYRAIVLSGNYEQAKGLLSDMMKYYLNKPSEMTFSTYRDSMVVNQAMMIKEAIETSLIPLETGLLMSGAFRAAASKLKTIEETFRCYQDMTKDICTKVSFSKKNYTTPVANCCKYITENLHDNITLDRLAEITHLSPHYLSRLFKKEVGISMVQYLTNQRVKAAKNLLLYSAYSIVEISSILAFSSQSYFSTVFRKETGMTPLNYRLHFSKGVRIS